MRSEKYNLVKNYYDDGLWNTARVRNAVLKSWITAAEYYEITGELLEHFVEQGTHINGQ